MTLAFPNPSRSFDRSRNAVRFSGYDGMFEVPFFVEAGVLARSGAGAGPDQTDQSEADYLSAFDARRSAIHDVARKAYSNGRRTNYMLTASDFR
ncbi:DUF1488 domain-containing protein [Chelatococcus sp. GCM10030263]|uniref:DUF1488 domain-containing protein n=1 Tax=Chelatococcus sp. GCM10030263 TaxID=3273387 RepID=UPI0036076383